MLQSFSRGLAALLFVGLLLACGNASTPAAQPAPTIARAAAPATASNSAPATAAVSTQPTQARAASATAPAAPATVAAEPTAASASGISEGVTAEGYHYLGRPDAPVTLVMYSDFL
jgi:hypothetical protein